MSRSSDTKRKLLTGSARWVLAAFVCLPASMAVDAAFAPAQAQQVADVLTQDRQLDGDEQLLLEADELTFDNDTETVVATGNVQIAYDGYTMVANKVTYNRRSGRVIASGDVEILEPSGNRIFAEEIDVTDDFQDGFVSALNVEAADNTRLAAASAERRDGNLTIFNDGVYTACPICEDNPEKPPLWQIRAKKVTINQETQTYEYEDATFEFFGTPVLRLPRFSHGDPNIQRKSGWLFPFVTNSENLGYGVRNGYFFNLAPNYDLTLYGTYYTKQGFLGEAEWRHRVENGSYKFRLAGIDQMKPEEFGDERIVNGLDDRYNFDPTRPDTLTFDEVNEERYALMTSGSFALNSRWTFGWDALFQSDENFARTYDLSGYDSSRITNEVYLTGLGEKNFFDLRAQDFLIQDRYELDRNPERSGLQTLQDQQVDVLPILDYNAVSDEDFELGQISLDVNVANLRRQVPQRIIQTVDLNGDGDTNDPGERFTDERDRHHGIEGSYTRASLEAEWKNGIVTDGGVMVTGFLGGRVDAVDFDPDNQTDLIGQNGQQNYITTLLQDESLVRTMPYAALEIRYPLVAHTDDATHVIEPIAQIIARPDEDYIGRFPNEDAQSFVFDASTLFDFDKFSGYDRVEGGTRANVGFRYSASFENGASFNFVAGQSFHLAGQNSFAERDLVNAGLESGLETDRSDYVAGMTLNNGQGLTLSANGRFDESDFELKRGEVGATFTSPEASLNLAYIFTDEQPEYALPEDRHEVSASGSVSLDENWRVSGNVSYDIENDTVIREGVGLHYNDECYTFSVNYANSRSRFTGDTTGQVVTFKFGFRTIGDFQHSQRINTN